MQSDVCDTGGRRAVPLRLFLGNALQNNHDRYTLDREIGSVTFHEVLESTITLLRSRGRVSYRSLKREFDIDDGFIEDLKDELTQTLRLARDCEVSSVLRAWFVRAY